MKYVGISIWVFVAVYCLFCIWFREIRFVYWKGTDSKIGTVSYVGATLFFWSPVLAILHLIPWAPLYVVMLFAFIITIIGGLMDMNKR